MFSHNSVFIFIFFVLYLKLLSWNQFVFWIIKLEYDIFYLLFAKDWPL